MKTELEIYLGAKEILSSADKWTKGVFARDENGVACMGSEADPRATCFCLSGALNLVSQKRFVYERRMSALVKAIERSMKERNITITSAKGTYLDTIVYFNDLEVTTYEDVIAVLDEAITEVSAQ
jgi:hypothetical protein